MENMVHRLLLGRKCWRLFLLSLLLAPVNMRAQVATPTENADSVASEKTLAEVNVIAKHLTREADRIVAMPTTEQRKHAHTGYDLVRNLMIPGVSVDRKTFKVNTPTGGATLYIDGREVDVREVRALRPRDVAKVEYIDMPTGKYAKDVAALNFVTKRLTHGGYTQIDALQGLGFLQGDYNVVSKYSVKNTNFNAWAGYAIQQPRNHITESEHFSLASGDVDRMGVLPERSTLSINKYAQCSVSRMKDRATWMIKGGLNYMRTFENKEGEWYYTGPITGRLATLQSGGERSLRPELFLYGTWKIGENQSIETVYDGYYSRNHYFNNNVEGGDTYKSDITENYLYSRLGVYYNLKLKHGNSLSFSLSEYLRLSKSHYHNLLPAWQRLRSSETILFVDYTQRVGRLFFDFKPGLSYLNYRLKGYDAITHVTPRLGFSVANRLSDVQLLRAELKLGNTYPTLNTVNYVTQQVDRVMLRRGNPDMHNSILYSPRLTYGLTFSRLAMNVSASYLFANHIITNDYHAEGDNMVNTFRSDTRYHAPSCSFSTTYRPSKMFNVKVDANWERNVLRGGTQLQHTKWSAALETNCYVNDFAFSASVKTPERQLVDNHKLVKTGWLYDIALSWNHNNIGVEMNCSNLFIKRNVTTTDLLAGVYAYHGERQSDWHNQYATLKMIWSVDYGKKTPKSVRNVRKEAESAIMKAE